MNGSDSESEEEIEGNELEDPVRPYQFEPAAKPKAVRQELLPSAATFVGRHQQDCNCKEWYELYSNNNDMASRTHTHKMIDTDVVHSKC